MGGVFLCPRVYRVLLSRFCYESVKMSNFRRGIEPRFLNEGKISNNGRVGVENSPDAVEDLNFVPSKLRDSSERWH